jgi:tRNA-dihydrouridine synthase
MPGFTKNETKEIKEIIERIGYAIIIIHGRIVYLDMILIDPNRDSFTVITSLHNSFPRTYFQYARYLETHMKETKAGSYQGNSECKVRGMAA